MRVVSRGPISCSQWIFLRRLGRTAVPTRKGSLRRDMPSIGMLVGLLLALIWQAASALLELSSSTSSSWRGLCQWPDWAPHWLGACALAPWACSWSLQGHKPYSAASSTSGSLKRFFCHRWLACSNRLACSWWPLEGLLAAAQNRPIRAPLGARAYPWIMSKYFLCVRACVRPCLCPPTDKRMVWIFCVKTLNLFGILRYSAHILRMIL